jgi:HEAT repeat protein
VTPASHWGVRPRDSIEAECGRRGAPAVVAGCVRLADGDDADPALVMALGGPAAGRFLDGSIRPDSYWLRVWGLRGLLWVWDDSAAPVTITALTDESWRVREMAAKVTAKHLVGDALPILAGMRGDPVERVRRATDRAIRLLTGTRA